ncbi:MAG: ribosome biogenesis GTPase Der [Spirochaetales bacterium]|nr:ribosome biogenesis GTPase Der [Spirochaetales bacterium]MCF7939309.1 ribosome biogenesis GTPase Der [Spirochaetales bacterium]
MKRILIVGRPNVGKSTLFNRLVGRRAAITDSVPGVTRDPVTEVIELTQQKVLLTDTGGYTHDTEQPFSELVSRRTISLLNEADLIIFLMDVTEITPEDEEFIEELRAFRRQVMLVVNKADNENRMQEAWNYLVYGFPVLGISAAHGVGIDELLKKMEELLPPVPQGGEEPSEEEPPEAEAKTGKNAETESGEIKIAILGKPNTGKSTLANSLVGSENSLVSEVPGTTRDVVRGEFVYQGRVFRILDTAGMRKKAKVHGRIEYYSVQRAIEGMESADLVFLLIDSVQDLSEQDKKIASLAVRKGKGIILVLNKWDMREGIPNEFRAVSDRVRFLFPVLGFAPIVPISALKNQGVEKLKRTAVEVFTQLNRQINTGTLNRLLQQWVDEFPPPLLQKGRTVRLMYMIQRNRNPVRFRIFGKRTDGLSESYRRYIENRIREDCGFDKIPVWVDFRESSSQSDGGRENVGGK